MVTNLARDLSTASIDQDGNREAMPVGIEYPIVN
jgi:hypothetical protein